MAELIALDPDGPVVRALARGTRPEREAALRTLMEAHSPRLHGVAARMLGDAVLAEDVVQETFLKAWDKAADWQPGRAKFATWLSRITVNACLDRLRRVRPRTGEALPEIADERPDAVLTLMRDDTRSEVRAAIKALPERQRAALILATYDQVSQSEGADILGITEGAYESLLVRARRNLRETFKETRHAV